MLRGLSFLFPLSCIVWNTADVYLPAIDVDAWACKEGEFDDDDEKDQVREAARIRQSEGSGEIVWAQGQW